MGAVAGQVVSPKQVARAIGVSESSLKRWCDQGLIKTVRTQGGHRKMAVHEVLRFVRDHEYHLACPEVLGLPPASQPERLGLPRSVPVLVDALLKGDEVLVRQIVFGLYMTNHSLSVIFDQVIAVAFQEIGARWACHSLEVYQERRGCELALRVLQDLRGSQRAPETTWLAIGGTIEGDHYALPTSMAELVLRDSGFHATSLGCSIPICSLVNSVRDLRPSVFWLSVSHISADPDFIADFSALSQMCSKAGTALVVGGRALAKDLRHRMTYSAFCDTMQHLEGFARTLYRSLTRGQGMATHIPSSTIGREIPTRLSGARITGAIDTDDQGVSKCNGGA